MINKDLAITYCGNENVFKKLVVRFLENYKDFIDELDKSDNKSDLIHQIKGITLNLGSEELYNISIKAMNDMNYYEAFKKEFNNVYNELKHLEF